MKRSSQAGFVLINMMGPVFGLVAVVMAIMWVVNSGWERFPGGAQVAVRVGGGALLVGFFLFIGVMAYRDRGSGRRF